MAPTVATMTGLVDRARLLATARRDAYDVERRTGVLWDGYARSNAAAANVLDGIVDQLGTQMAALVDPLIRVAADLSCEEADLVADLIRAGAGEPRAQAFLVAHAHADRSPVEHRHHHLYAGM